MFTKLHILARRQKRSSLRDALAAGALALFLGVGAAAIANTNAVVPARADNERAMTDDGSAADELADDDALICTPESLDYHC